jgi:hypothetical protein
MFFHTRIADDGALTILCYSIGFVALDYNSPGQVFAVKNNGIPDSPDALVRDGYAIAHSVKADPRWPESEIREVFSKVRQKLLASNPSRRGCSALMKQLGQASASSEKPQSEH